MIWLIGKNGMLGSDVARQLTQNSLDFIGTGHEVDVTNFSELEKFALLHKDILYIVNCSAYTAVDKAETEKDLAKSINVDGVKNIAVLAKKIGAKLIHVSTDYVFDGNSIVPYTENMEVCPLGVYGTTKALGEQMIINELSDFYILRTSWLYGWSGKNFVYTMIRAMNMRLELKVVNDQKGTPTFSMDLACAIIKIIQKNNVPSGIYHFSNNGQTTWYEFACKIQSKAKELNLLKNLSCTIYPCKTSEYPTPTKRPAYSVLSKQKIEKELSISIPEWEESLQQFLSDKRFDKNRLL